MNKIQGIVYYIKLAMGLILVAIGILIEFTLFTDYSDDYVTTLGEPGNHHLLFGLSTIAGAIILTFTKKEQ